jgi:hypothetical protein
MRWQLSRITTMQMRKTTKTIAEKMQEEENDADDEE